MGCSLISLAIFMGTAIATPETTNVKVCSNTGTSYILPPLPGNLRESNVTVIDVSWSRRNVSSNKWTVVLHWHHSNGCHMSTNSWAFGTRIQCSSEGKLIVDLMEGRHPGTFAHYLVEGRLSDSSHVHHFYKVEFIECLKTWIDASINLTDEIRKLLPHDAWKRLVEISFLDINNTYIARYKPGHCCDLISFENITTFPWLCWTRRLNPTGENLKLTRIQQSDNLRDIQVRIVLSSLKSDIEQNQVDISLRIIVDASQRSQPHVTDKTHTLQLSTYRGFPQPSAENEVTRTSPTWLTSSSARSPKKYWICAIVVLVVAVVNCLN